MSLYVYFSGVFAKLKSNSVVQAEPLELHFSGFEEEKDYRKILVGFSLLVKKKNSFFCMKIFVECLHGSCNGHTV